MAQKKSLSDEEFKKIPIVQLMNTYLSLLETLAESPKPKDGVFMVVKLTDVAKRLSVKTGKTYSSRATSQLIRNLFGDHVIEKHQSRYYAAIDIDHLSEFLKKYKRWRV